MPDNAGCAKVLSEYNSCPMFPQIILSHTPPIVDNQDALVAGGGATDGGIKRSGNRASFERIWLREHGLSIQFSRVRRLNQLSGAEQLLAALLREDREECARILSDYGDDISADFASLVELECMASIVLQRLIDLDIGKALSAASVQKALAKISRLAVKQVSRQLAFDRYFEKLLHLLSDLNEDVLWIKGAYLCRALYERPEFRQCGDFDIMTRLDRVELIVERLQLAKFKLLTEPAFCNQVGVGPSARPSDLFLSPNPGWAPTSVLALQSTQHPFCVDIKVAPMDRGVQAADLEHFFLQAEQPNYLGLKYRAPCLEDHLLIMLHNYEKDRFRTWRTLMDIHLIAQKLDTQAWQHFVRRCEVEAISCGAWLGLSIAVDRLKTTVPAAVLESLEPKQSARAFFYFIVSSCFVWNTTSLPMLVVNALVSQDRAKKLRLLRGAFLPSREFLNTYYAQPGSRSFAQLFQLALHWLVLILPGGAARRILRNKIWRESEHAQNS